MASLLEHTNIYHQSKEDRKFRCEECGRGYRHAGSLANHRKTHEIGSFQCHICSRKLSNALALKSHLRIHTSRKKYSCSACGKAFRLATQLATHQKVHRNNEFQGRTRAKDYAESGYKVDDLPQLDEVDFDIIPDLQPDMKLNIAPISSLSNDELSEHVPDSTPGSDTAADDDAEDRPFKCDMCGKTYRHHGSLINHKKTHQMGIFECPVCFKQFNNLAALTSHQRTHSKTRGRPSAPTSKASPPDCKPELASHVMPQNGDANVNFCHLCQVVFPNDDEFQNHILLHNSSSVSFELPTSLSEEQNFTYSDSVTHSPESNLYPPSSDTPPLPPLLDKTVDFDQSEGPMENGHIYVPNSLDGNSLTIHAQGQPMALSENLNLSQGTDDIKLEDADSSDRRFKCHICGKSYRHAGSLINHKRSHQTGVFQCSICRKNYPHLAALRSHLRIHKGKPSSLSASTEGDWLSSEPLTHENQQSCFPSHEGDVSEILGLPQDLVESVQHTSDDELVNETNATEFCEQFENSFPVDRPVHLPQEEALVERHMCADCGKTFIDIAGIKSHMCPLLNQQYQTTTNMSSDHMDFHDTKHQDFLGESEEHIGFEEHNGSATEDYFREETFHDNMHMEMSDGEDDEEECEEGEEEDDGEMYQCSVCGNHYTNLRALRSHLRGHTQTHDTSLASIPSSLSTLEIKQDEPIDNPQGDGSLIICSTCGESFATQQDLQAHQLLHGNTEDDPAEQNVIDNQPELEPKLEVESIICEKCGISSSDLYHLNNCTGQRDEQEEEKCEEKPLLRSIFQRGLLQESLRDGERQYRCDQCGRSYRHAGSLLNHKKSHKTGVFRCFVCQKRFYNLLALKNHQRTHFDVKKHRCTECGKAFKIHKQLLNHQRVHQENKAKIEELNRQIQTLMQMSGNATVSGTQGPNSSRKRISRRRKQRLVLSSNSSQEKEGCIGDPNDPRPYVCDQCGRSYRHAGSLVNHKNSHKTGEYYCALCNNTYSNQLAMKNHLRIHFSVKRHRCQDCGKAFRGSKQLLNHTCTVTKKTKAARGKVRGHKKEKVLKCKSCLLVFPDTELLLGHGCSKEASDSPESADVPESANVHSDIAPLEKEERPFKCNICSRSYRHAGSLLNHKNTHKTGHFTCSFCAKPFSNPMALRNHTRIHTQKKKYVCPTCGKAFRLSSILYNHQKIHARGISHYSCQTCGKSFQGRSGLKRHRCYRSGNPNTTVSQDSGDKCYTCDQCGRSYRHAGSLLNHKKTHSADLLHCTLCLKTFTNALDLESHSQMARHCCPDCGKTFCEFAHLQSHMEVHSKSLPYYCNLCQQNFPNLASYQQHQELHANLQEQSHDHQDMQMQQDMGWESALDQQIGIQSLPKIESAFSRVHGFAETQDQQESSEGCSREEKSHVCEHCGRTYRHAGSLLNHKNSHKTGSFFCSVCQKEFTNLMALKNHRRIHTEPKRYQCLECGKAFRVSTQLICHRRIHTKEKPFSCVLCDKRFSSKSNLRHHQKMHQSNQETYESSYSMDDNEFMGLGVDPFL